MTKDPITIRPTDRAIGQFPCTGHLFNNMSIPFQHTGIHPSNPSNPSDSVSLLSSMLGRWNVKESSLIWLPRNAAAAPPPPEAAGGETGTRSQLCSYARSDSSVVRVGKVRGREDNKATAQQHCGWDGMGWEGMDNGHDMTRRESREGGLFLWPSQEPLT